MVYLAAESATHKRRMQVAACQPDAVMPTLHSTALAAELCKDCDLSGAHLYAGWNCNVWLNARHWAIHQECIACVLAACHIHLQLTPRHGGIYQELITSACRICLQLTSRHGGIHQEALQGVDLMLVLVAVSPGQVPFELVAARQLVQGRCCPLHTGSRLQGDLQHSTSLQAY